MDSELPRMNCKTFFITFNSGYLAGSGNSVILGDTWNGALFQNHGQRLAVSLGEEPGLAWRVAVDQPLRPLGVAAQNAAADDCRVTPPSCVAAVRDPPS